MNAPPPIHGFSAPPPKRTNWALWIGLGVVVGGGCLCIPIVAAILLPVFAQARDAAKMTMALSNVKQIGIGLSMYTGDFDDKLPPSAEWADRVSNYSINPAAFHSPALGTDGYGYAFRKSLAGKSLAKIPSPATKAMVFDSTVDGRSAVGELDSLPNPARYRKGNAICFTDGHAKFVPADRISTLD